MTRTRQAPISYNGASNTHMATRQALRTDHYASVITFEHYSPETGRCDIALPWQTALEYVRKHHGIVKPVRVIWRDHSKLSDSTHSSGWSWASVTCRDGLYALCNSGNPFLYETRRHPAAYDQGPA